MTAQGIIDYARYVIDGYGDAKWTDAVVLGYVNEGIHSLNNYLMHKNSNVIVKSATFNTVAAQADYVLTSAGIVSANDFIKMYKLFDTSSSHEIRVINYEERYADANPYCYVFGSNLTIAPTPSDIRAHELLYFYKLSDLVLTPAPTSPSWMPDIYHEILSFFAAVRMAEQDKQASDNVKLEYQKKFQEYSDYVFGNRKNSVIYHPAGELW